MIVLRVLSYNGAPAEGPMAQFDEIGGTIGRADNNQLVLPDPERTISRVHARVVFRGGGYAVVDNGSNPINVNGQQVGAGREQALAPGDQLQIGGYVLVASATAPAPSDPFGELFGDAPMGLAVAPAAPASRTAPTLMGTGAGPTAMWPTPAAAPPAPRSAPNPAAVTKRAAAALTPGHIPDDWDPFADHDAEPAAPAFGGEPADAFAGLPPGGGNSLDDLFGLSASAFSGDPLGAQPAQAVMAPPNTAQHADALQSLNRAAVITPASRSDHLSELNSPMLLGRAAAAPVVTEPTPLPAGAVFTWNDPPRDGRVVTLPGPPRPASGVVPSPSGPLARAAVPASALGGRPAVQRAAAPAADDELLAGLLAGLGAPGLRIDSLTPQTMQLIGRLLRESTRGMVELLVARAALKRELRAEMTMIVSRENNPLKFSPSVDVALQHLLGPPSPGFLPAAQAMRDACDDLRAHQLGVMAGMRAALDGVLKRFDPAQLEAKLTRKSAISSIIPAARKARLWELFQELFSQLQTEAQEDFDELFGQAFLKAYDDQLNRLHRESGPL